MSKIPPRKSAGLWKKGYPRNEAGLVMRKEGLAHWREISGYHRPSLAETTMYRFKRLLAGKISLRNYNGQVGEVMTCWLNLGNNANKKYIVLHDEDNFGRGAHFHGADDSKGSPMLPEKYKQYPGHFPEIILGFKKGKSKK